MKPGCWYALKVKPRAEKSVFSAAPAKGFEPFLPIYRVRKQWSDRVVEQELPLFPGYLFVRATEALTGRIVEAPGAIGFVSFGAGPEPVPEYEIEMIRTLTRSGRTLAPHPYLRVGSRVRVGTGPLEGVEGILEQVRGAGRLVVSMNLLMRSVMVTLDEDQITPLAVKGTSAGQHVQR